jgi:hypothetical protein
MPSPSLRNFEHAQNMAVNLRDSHGYELSDRPGLFYDETVRKRTETLELHVPNVIDFAADKHNVDPACLSSLALYFRDPESMPGQKGFIEEYQLFNNTLYFPVINISLGKHRTASLNATLRHELRHIFQTERKSLYNRPGVLRTIQAIGGAATTYGMIKGFMDYDSGDWIGAVLSETMAACLTPAIHDYGASRIAWVAEWKEQDANLFSIKNHSFRPITQIG